MSPARTKRSGRVAGSPEGRLESSSLMRVRRKGRLTGRVTIWMRLVRKSASILIFPTIRASSESVTGPLVAAPCGAPGAPGGAPCTEALVPAGFSNILVSRSTTSLASARWSWKNSLTTSAGLLSRRATTCAKLRMISAVSVTNTAWDLGSATMLVTPGVGATTWSSAVLTSCGSAYSSLKRKETTWLLSGNWQTSERMGMLNCRAFLLVLMTLTMSPGPGISVKLFSAKTVSKMRMASRRETGLRTRTRIFPCTVVSKRAFLPVSCSYSPSTSLISVFGKSMD